MSLDDEAVRVSGLKARLAAAEAQVKEARERMKLLEEALEEGHGKHCPCADCGPIPNPGGAATLSAMVGVESRPGRVRPNPPPRYDDVFAQGTAALDADALEAPAAERDEALRERDEARALARTLERTLLSVSDVHRESVRELRAAHPWLCDADTDAALAEQVAQEMGEREPLPTDGVRLRAKRRGS